MRLPKPDVSQAVLVGCSEFSDPQLEDLPAVANNLADLRNYLTSKSGTGLRPNACTVAANPHRERDVGAALMLAARNASDTLLVYFTSHGILDARGRLYLALRDTDLSMLSWTALPFELIREAILESPARNRILLIDCCFSGRAIEAMASMDSTVSAQLDVSGTLILTSSTSNELSFSPTGARNTAFTGEILNILGHGMRGRGPLLSFLDVYREVRSRLVARGLPEPQSRGTKTIDELAIGSNTFVRATTRSRASTKLASEVASLLNRDTTLEDHRARARDFMAIGQYSKAEEILGALTIKNPDRMWIWLDYGLSLEAQGKTVDAESVYRTAMESAGNEYAGIYLARLMVRIGSFDDAVVLCRELRDAFPLSRELGLVEHAANSRLTIPFPEFEPSATATRYSSQRGMRVSSLDRARMHNSRNEFDSAEEMYKLAIDETGGTSVGLRLDLGWMYERAGRPDDAETLYRQILRKQPDHALSQMALGRFLARNGRKDEAIAYYTELVSNDPGADKSRLETLLADLRRFGDGPAGRW